MARIGHGANRVRDNLEHSVHPLGVAKEREVPAQLVVQRRHEVVPGKETVGHEGPDISPDDVELRIRPEIERPEIIGKDQPVGRLEIAQLFQKRALNVDSGAEGVGAARVELVERRRLERDVRRNRDSHVDVRVDQPPDVRILAARLQKRRQPDRAAPKVRGNDGDAGGALIQCEHSWLWRRSA